jgi:hypothetical protein
MQLRAGSGFWHRDAVFQSILQTHHKFRECSFFLVIGLWSSCCAVVAWLFCTMPIGAVATKLAANGYQPHLEDFLLRLDFNSFYQTGLARQ